MTIDYMKVEDKTIDELWFAYCMSRAKEHDCIILSKQKSLEDKKEELKNKII